MLLGEERVATKAVTIGEKEEGEIVATAIRLMERRKKRELELRKLL